MTSHPADEWFARTYKGAPTDSRELLRAAFDAGASSERTRTLAICDRVTACWIEPLALSAVRLVREEVAREKTC